MTALCIVLIIAALIALIVLIPIDLAFKVNYYDNNSEITLGITYFLLKIPIIPPKTKEKKKNKKKKPEEKKDEEEEKEDKPPKAKKPLNVTIRLARTVWEECAPDAVKLIKHLFGHTLQTRKFKISALFGTGNPMNTGLAYGAASAALYNLIAFIDTHSKLYEWSIDLQPDFERAMVQGAAEITIRTRIAYVLKLAFMAGILILKILKINRRINKNATEQSK